MRGMPLVSRILLGVAACLLLVAAALRHERRRSTPQPPCARDARGAPRRQRRSVVCCQSFQSDARHAARLPFLLELCSKLAIEAYRGFIPVEHRPLEAAAAALEGESGEPSEKMPAHSATALRGC